MPADTYIVTGIVQVCIFSQWTEQPIQIELQAAGEDEAIKEALEVCKCTAERQDKYATVRWKDQSAVASHSSSPYYVR